MISQKSHGVNKLHKENNDYFKTINSHEKAYLLGFLYADGYVTIKPNYMIRLNIHEKDIEVLKLFKKELETTREIENDNYTSTPKKYLSFTNKQLVNDIIKLGCIPKKSYSLVFPTEEQVPREFIESFIVGYFDGDGSLSIKNMSNVRMDLTGTKEFLSELVKFLPTNVSNGYKIVQEHRCTNKKIYLCGQKNNYNLFHYLYSKSPIHLSRKYNNYLELCNYLNLPSN